MTSINPLAEPSRIAFVGDVHMNAHWLEVVIDDAKAQGADVIVQLGDFGYDFTPSFMRTISRALGRAGLLLLFVDGNHENFGCLYSLPIGADGLRPLGSHIWHLPRGFRWTWSGVRFLALGGAHSVDRPYRTPGMSWWPQEWISDDEAAAAIAGGPADVLISHDCPSGVVIPGIDDRAAPPPFPPAEILTAHEHRRIVRRVVDAVRPKQVWHGHYHVDYEQTVDLGWGPMTVTGLNCDETSIEANLRVVELPNLREQMQW